ncbi:uncharacterized protein LOC121417411 [Lytechinus variegatus]|uniref:uncharacterized protein LOC121417411 n=1 Tax=Lytechinus variegatus TaxID=7654 RepID=UPI001BB13891|nr:uncharacterized protein LOC121417411 [Lytechinus variegatus]
MGAKGSKKSNRATVDNADPGSGIAGNGQRDETPSGDPKPSVESGKDAAVSSTEAVTAAQAVETSSAQDRASGGAGTTPATESSKQEATTDILDTTGGSGKVVFPAHWIGFREIFVQYIPGKPYTLTEFGAHLYSFNGPHGRHEFRAIDGSGLARKVGLRNRDVLLSINNLTSGLTNSSPLAILECLTDIGPNIALVVERNGNETWLFAFHLDEEGNRPIVKELFTHKFDHHIRTFPFSVIIPPNAAFDVAAQYTYDSSTPVQIILKEDDQYMEIDTDKATFVPASQTLTLNLYERIDKRNEVGDGGIPVAISTPTPHSNVEKGAESGSYCHDPMCVEGVSEGPLGVVVFPSWMTEPNTVIPQNNMFFLTSLDPTGDAVFEAANTPQELYMISSVDNQDPSVLLASLGKSIADFRVIRVDSGSQTSLKDIFLRLADSEQRPES